MSFSADLRRFRKTAGSTAEKMFRAKVIGVMNNIVRRTPVDTGRLRGNWNASLNSPDRSTTDSTTPKMGEAQSVMQRAGNGDTAYFTNNLPYAGDIESGTSKQAPIGMMKISVLEASD